MNIDYFPLEACMMLSDTMKANPLGGGFHIRCSLDPPGSVSKVHGVFINSNLPPTSGEATKGKSITKGLAQTEILHICNYAIGRDNVKIKFGL